MIEEATHITACFTCRNEMVTEQVKQTYLAGMDWILSAQASDGACGRSWEEQALLTPHLVQLLVEAGTPADSRRLRSSVAWLKEKLTHGDRPMWYGRLPALAAAGETDWLLGNNDVYEYLEDFRMHRIPDFFWYVLPTMIWLRRTGVEIPADEIIEELDKYRINHGDGIASITNQPNHTALAALFLAELDADKYSEDIDSYLKWITIGHRSDNSRGTVHWDDSIGVTSYVLMDFVHLGVTNHPDVEPLILPALRYFKSFENGKLPEDRFSSSYGTSIHESSTYTTLLALRAIATVAGREDCLMRSISAASIETSIDLGIRDIIKKRMRGRKRILIIGGAAIFGVGAFAIVLLTMGVGQGIVNILLLILGALLAVVANRIFSPGGG